jgi:hypothetical protein
MPRRARVSKRREADPLDVAGALAAADVFGCAGIAEHVTLEELAQLHARVPTQQSPTVWRWLAFDVGHPRPCQALEAFDPFSGVTESAGLTCGSACRFADSEGYA